MAFINKQDTNGLIDALAKGEFGYDDYAAGGDKGRVYIGSGDNTIYGADSDGNIPLAKLLEIVQKTSTTGSAVLPSGTTAQRDGTPSAGYLRWNTTEGSAEIYDGSAWGSVGGGAVDDMFYENAQTVTADYTLPSGRNAMTAGPVTVDSDVTVTISSGSSWTVV